MSDYTLGTNRGEDRRVAFATMVGSTVEWYDFFLYANAAALVFGPLFFAPLANDNPFMGQLLGFATAGIGFVFRPIGAVVVGRLGDMLGRKKMTVATLLLMGAATMGIGLLPTYATIGMAAPILLVLMRIMQGVSAGGEWGGAALMAVEHSPTNRRGWFGAFPQVGIPGGMITATGMILLSRAVLGEEAFLAWGWRIPFLASVIMIATGLYIRLGISESPVFEKLNRDGRTRNKINTLELIRDHWPNMLKGALTFAANGVAGNMIVGGFILSHTSGPNGLGMNPNHVLAIITSSGFIWIATTLWAGHLSDKIGRVRTYQMGYALQALWVFPMFYFVETATTWGIIVAVVPLVLVLGMTLGQQSAMFAEMFPADVRYSCANLSYAVGTIIGSAFAPLIATALTERYASVLAVGVYIAVSTVVSLVAVSLIKDRTGTSLH